MTDRRRSAQIAAIFSAVVLLMIPLFAGLHYIGFSIVRTIPAVSTGDDRFSVSPHGPHRKLLHGEAAATIVEPDRVWGDKCSKADIVITQGSTSPLPSGIPTYTVEIMNVCVTGCDIAGIHFSCGWFSSARLINPKIFKRLRYNDCLVNNGKSLANGRTLSFQYANTFRYPLSVQRVKC